MKKILLSLMFILGSVLTYGQSEQRIAVALQPIPGSGTAGNLPFAQIISNAKVYVCAYNVQLSCITPVAVYADPNLTPPALSQPLSANILGQYQYYIQSGSQVVENICSPYNQCHAQSVYFSNAGESTNTIKVNGTIVTNPNLVSDADIIFENGRPVVWASTGPNIEAGLLGDGNALHYFDGTGNFSTPPGQITGQASNFVPLGCTATSICGQAHLSDDGTNLSTNENIKINGKALSLFDSTGAFSGGSILANNATASSGNMFLTLPNITTGTLDDWFVFRNGGIQNKWYLSSDGTNSYIQTGTGHDMWFGPGCGAIASTGCGAQNLILSSTNHSTAVGGGFYTAINDNLGTCTTTATVDPVNGNHQSITLTHGMACALTFTQPSVGTTTVTLKITQSAVSTFNGTITGCKWPGGLVPTITAASAAVDLLTAYLDGTTAYCSISQDLR